MDMTHNKPDCVQFEKIDLQKSTNSIMVRIFSIYDKNKSKILYRTSDLGLCSSLVLGALAKRGNVICNIVANALILDMFDCYDVAVFVNHQSNIAF